MSSQVLSELTPEMNEELRMEIGWTEVAAGLARILWGYLVCFLAIVIGLGMVAVSLYGLPDANGMMRMRPANSSSLWECYTGLAILVLGCVFSYMMLASGHFRCMMGAAERKGARWLMFFCITCMFMGPALNFVAGVVGAERGINLDHGARTFTEMRFNQRGQNLRVVAFIISQFYPWLFLLFLRSVAACMHARILSTLLALFLVADLCLVGYTGYLIYNPMPSHVTGKMSMILLGGWVALGLGYLGFIAATRVCILMTMNRVRSPLELT